MTILSLLILLVIASVPPTCVSLGGSSAATISVVYGGAPAVCTITAYQPIQIIQCFSNGRTFTIPPTTSAFTAIAGGQDTLCAARSGGATLLCYDTTNFAPKRIYNNASNPLTAVAVGSTQICGLTQNATSPNVICWRGYEVPLVSSLNVSPPLFSQISSGLSFSCGVLKNTSKIVCWGGDGSEEVQSAFSNYSMLSVEVGGRFACGINETGQVICVGSNANGQLIVPSNAPFEYRALTLGSTHGCAIRRLNRTVACWGGNGEFSSRTVESVSFEQIVAGLNFTCGLVTRNFSVICWGPGWISSSGNELPLSKSLPGPCVNTVCECNLYPESDALCAGNGHVCRPCDVPKIPPSVPPSSSSPSPPPQDSRSPSKRLSRGLLIFAVIGSVGGLCAICTAIYLWWSGVCFGKKKIHNSVQPTITTANNVHQPNSTPPYSRSSTLRRQGSILMRRQRSGTSSKHTERAEEFSLADLVIATNDFAMENKIGSGSFGVVYRGKLQDGREVAIKRSESGPRTKKFQEKESAFESELAFLSRLHHKHLVRLVGYCEEREERLLVYEYMKNGALYDHLHSKNNTEKGCSVVNSWKVRIKIALDAARGIEYLHNYAVPPIIHRDIKSSNILLDADWTARVSDFGLSLMGPENDRSYRPAKAAGTVGYIDPEYYGLNVLTAKSDVYGLGVVLLELLTGKRAIFKTGEDTPISVVDYAVPAIMGGELSKILDPRVGPPEVSECEAVELVGYTARHCVHLEGKDRPTMTDIVANLERALILCGDDSHGSISSSGIVSIVSE